MARIEDDFVSARPDIRREIPAEQRGSSTLHFANGNLGEGLSGITDPSMVAGGSEPTMVSRNRTESGHIIEYNDTPGGERVLIKHASGAGVDMLPDGSVAISSRGQLVMTIDKDMTIRVTGNMRYDVTGNFDVKVSGNMNVDCLNYNVTTSGNYNENIAGARRAKVSGNVGNNILGSLSNTVVGTNTDTILGDRNLISKGTTRITAGQSLNIASGEKTKITSETGLDISSTNVNIAANSLTAIGASGTIGGQNMQMYTRNLRAGGTVYADVSLDTPKGNITRVSGTSAHYTTFHGDLNGTAKQSNITAAQNYPDTDPGGNTSGSPYSFTSSTADDLANNTVASALPTPDILSEYLTVSSKGIIQVEVDADNEIVNMLDRSVFNGGLRSGDLSTSDVRSLLRDPSNASNNDFVANNISAGILNPTVANASPPGIGRISGSAPGTYYGNSGNGAGRFFTPAKTSAKRTFLPDVKHYIHTTTSINEDTELLDGIRLAAFLGKD